MTLCLHTRGESWHGSYRRLSCVAPNNGHVSPWSRPPAPPGEPGSVCDVSYVPVCFNTGGGTQEARQPRLAPGRALGSDCDPGCLGVVGSSPSRALDPGKKARGLGTAAPPTLG